MPATPAITFASAKTVPQEITYALIWIGTNQILTTGKSLLVEGVDSNLATRADSVIVGPA